MAMDLHGKAAAAASKATPNLTAKSNMRPSMFMPRANKRKDTMPRAGKRKNTPACRVCIHARAAVYICKGRRALHACLEMWAHNREARDAATKIKPLCICTHRQNTPAASITTPCTTPSRHTPLRIF